MNVTLIEVKDKLNDAWQDLEEAINVAYDDGYSGMIYQIKRIQLEIERLEVMIDEKEYGDDEDV